MKVLVVAISLISCCVAGEVGYGPRHGLLVLPPNGSTTSTPSPQNDDRENLQGFNDRIMERLRQEAGSERGVYHVYFPDGRLQRVQYTAAPISGQQGQQLQTTSYSQQQYQNVPSVRNTYYVEVPAERLQALRVVPQDQVYQQQQQADFQQPQASEKYAESPQVNEQFVPLQVVTVDQLAQYNAKN